MFSQKSWKARASLNFSDLKSEKEIVLTQKKLYDTYRTMVREKQLAHNVFDNKMKEIQEKRLLVMSHREGLKEDFLKHKYGGRSYNSKFRTLNTKK